jgi:hypothetical protein
MIMYRLLEEIPDVQMACVLKDDGNGTKLCIPMSEANTDYQNFKTAVLDQQPGGAVVEDGDSFSINANPNDSILEDADGNVMTIDEAKAYVRTLP